MATDLALRELDPAADRAALSALWRAALHPAWPPLPAALDMIMGGLVAEEGGAVAGVVALDPAGSVQLLLVDPARQRRGLGTALHDAALARLGELGARTARLGSGGADYFWPGVPDDLPAAARFFAARGWDWFETVTDLVLDLRGYRTPAGVHERARQAGIRVEVAGDHDRDQVLEFEATTFPNWLRWFERGQDAILVARDAGDRVVGSLLFHGPDEGLLLAPLLGPRCGAISCVGVADHARDLGVGTAMVARASELLQAAATRACHIGWTVRVAFYARLGYAPWRRYLMASRPLG